MALDQAFASSNLTPESGMNQFFRSLALLYNNRAEEAYDFISRNVVEPGIDMWTQLTIFLKYVLKKDREKLSSLLIPDFVKSIQIDPQNLYHMATFYSYLGEKKNHWNILKMQSDRGFINYPLLSKHDILLNNIRDEERFKKLMEQVKYEWENFEI